MEANFNPNDSIKTIEDALRNAKAEKTGAQFYYLLWGTALFIHYFLFYLSYEYPELNGGLLSTLTWCVFPIGGYLSYRRNKKDEITEKALTHYEKVYLFSFGAFALTYGVVFISSIVQLSSLYISLFPLLLGTAVFVVGGITKHRVSLVGGTIAIIFTGISMNTPIELQYLFAALSTITACIVPGLFMKK